MAHLAKGLGRNVRCAEQHGEEEADVGAHIAPEVLLAPGRQVCRQQQGNFSRGWSVRWRVQSQRLHRLSHCTSMVYMCMDRQESCRSFHLLHNEPLWWCSPKTELTA